MLYEKYKDDPIKSLSFPAFNLIFSPFRLNEDLVQDILTKFRLIYPRRIVVYPEALLLRGELEGYVAELASKQAWDGLTIVTDSDDLLNHFRVAVKERRLRKQQMGVSFYEFYDLQHDAMKFMQVDEDGRFDGNFPKWMNTHMEALIRLL